MTSLQHLLPSLPQHKKTQLLFLMEGLGQQRWGGEDLIANRDTLTTTFAALKVTVPLNAFTK